MRNLEHSARMYIAGALLITGLSALACATDQTPPDKRPVCGRSAEVWKMMDGSTRELLKKSCVIEFSECRKASADVCQIRWVFAAEHHKLQAWDQSHAKADAVDQLAAYETLFLKPMFQAHVTHGRVFSGEGQDDDAWRKRLKEARELLKLESRAPTETFILKIRDRIREVPNPAKRELLIETYGRMRALDNLIFEPREDVDSWERAVRERLEQFEAAVVKLEFLPNDAAPATPTAPSAGEDVPPPPPAASPDAPPPGETPPPPPPPVEEAPATPAEKKKSSKKKKEDAIKVLQPAPKPKDSGTDTPTE